VGISAAAFVGGVYANQHTTLTIPNLRTFKAESQGKIATQKETTGQRNQIQAISAQRKPIKITESKLDQQQYSSSNDAKKSGQKKEPAGTSADKEPQAPKKCSLSKQHTTDFLSKVPVKSKCSQTEEPKGKCGKMTQPPPTNKCNRVKEPETNKCNKCDETKPQPINKEPAAKCGSPTPPANKCNQVKEAETKSNCNKCFKEPAPKCGNPPTPPPTNKCNRDEDKCGNRMSEPAGKCGEKKPPIVDKCNVTKTEEKSCEKKVCRAKEPSPAPRKRCNRRCKPEQKKPPATTEGAADEGWRRWTRSGPQNAQQNEQMQLTDGDSPKMNLVDGGLLELDAKEKLP